MKRESIQRQLEELQLIQCSLLPTEHLTFLDDTSALWMHALDKYSEDPFASLPHLKSAPLASIHVDNTKIWFEARPNDDASKITVSVKGEDITRAEQERWRSIVVEKMEEISDSEFPMYQLVSLHLLPLLHNEVQTEQFQKLDQEAPTKPRDLSFSDPFHVLFNSHHLISPKKRRSLQQWSSSLSLTGFAKVGYPGVIYAQGERTNVEEFVENVKAMQWLALKVRFAEPIPTTSGRGSVYEAEHRAWKEFQKVGEVVEEMRRIGREEYVIEMVPYGRISEFDPQALNRLASLVHSLSEAYPGARAAAIRYRDRPAFKLKLRPTHWLRSCHHLSLLGIRPPSLINLYAAMSALRFKVSRGALTTIAPPIPRAYEWASRFKATSSHPLLDMSQGVPGIPPPEAVQSALGVAAASPASFGYCRWDGEPALRKALVNEMKVVYGNESDVKEDDVALTAGCNLAFVAVAMSVVDPGDEVILPIPWYFNHQMTLNLLGVKVISLHTRSEDGFTPSVDRCRELINAKTRAIVLVTPNNPTGATYSPSLIASFAKLAREKNLALIIDETYRDFVVTGAPPHGLFSSSSPDPWRSTFIHLFSFSKSYCLPGHRLGAIIASPLFLESVRSVLDTVQICPPRPIQLALAPLLPGLRTFVKGTAKQLHTRHALFKGCLPPRWRVGAQGGYFAFVRHPFHRVKAEDVSRRLAEEVGVVSLPSGFFSEETRQDDIEEDVLDWSKVELDGEVEEEERWIRFSVANVSDEKVKKVCLRLGACEGDFGWKVEGVKGGNAT